MEPTTGNFAKLQDVALLQSGYAVRGRGSNLNAGNIRIVQSRCLAALPNIDLDYASFIETGEVSSRHKLRNKDLLFRTRGARFDAALYKDDGIPSYAATPTIVIRTIPQNLSPEYLHWFLNNDPETRKHLNRNSFGHNIRLIKLAQVAELLIPIPPIETQYKIVEASKLVTRQESIFKQLTNAYRLQANATLGNAARASSRRI